MTLYTRIKIGQHKEMLTNYFIVSPSYGITKHVNSINALSIQMYKIINRLH